MKIGDLISIDDLTRDWIEEIISLAQEMEKVKNSNSLRGKIVALAFFEPSTRTRLSFETAAKRLGADVIGFDSPEGSSISKGESFGDTIKMLDSYSDLIVVRHKNEGAAKYASEIAEKPVINAGDGMGEHPTQALLDLYTIIKAKGGVEGLRIGLLGDLKYSRTIVSLIKIFKKFRPEKVYLISPPQLRIRKEILEEINFPFEETSNLQEVISELDVLYVTRLQKERFPDLIEYNRAKGSYKLDKRLVSMMKKDSIILHPLPRVDEIDREVDGDSRAMYFKQAQYGIPIRMAILQNMLGE
jgi:aspartate carbamoyltransferase catalytic subunit